MDFQFRKTVLLIGDVLLLYVSLYLTLLLRFFGTFDSSLFVSHAIPFTTLNLVWVVVFYVIDLYDLRVVPASTAFFGRLAAALLFMFFTGVTFFYIVNFAAITPKTNLVIHLIVFACFAFFWRLLFSRLLSPLVPWRVGMFKSEGQITELTYLINSHAHLGYTAVLIEPNQNDLLAVIEQEHIHVLVLPQATERSLELTQTFYQCLRTGVTFLEPSQAFEMFAKRIPISATDQYWFIRNFQERDHRFFKHTKRLFDFVMALLIFITTSPLFFLIIVCLWIDDRRGGIFYTQERVGKEGKIFRIKKFRTMWVDAERDGATWATKNDSRVTRVGKILRWTHLDELPQMINVLKGDISLVGPRPERPEFVEQLNREILHYHVRHFVQPGFTGWAQIRYRYARSVTDSQTKFEYDLYYIKNRSFILDFLILLKTAQLLFRREE